MLKKKYHDLTGGKISIKKSDENPLFAQGIVLTSINHKTAFNNQVPTRLLRYQSEMRKLFTANFRLNSADTSAQRILPHSGYFRTESGFSAEIQ